MAPNVFFAKYGPLAQTLCKGTGLCASIMLAQAALESAWGTSGLTTRCNNFFGLKAGSTWRGPVGRFKTGEQTKDGKKFVIMAAFRSYPTPEASFKDRIALFRAWPRYKNLFELDNYAQEAAKLKADGYATDVLYPQKLINMVRLHKLDQYDEK